MMGNKPRYEIVVSAENNHYMGWQAMLFHYTCLKHLGHAPLIVVHSDESRLLPEFGAIAQKGGRIQPAQNFRHHGRMDYPPRNTAGTLSCVKTDADYLVLCDPDMLFVGPPSFDRYRLATNRISVDPSASFLRVNDDNRLVLTQACKRASLELDQLERTPITGGVPHIVPVSLRGVLSKEWLRCMDFFIENRRSDAAQSKRQTPWLTSMWALVLAIHRLRLEVVSTHFAITNYYGAQPLPSRVDGEPFLIHYAYGDSIFNKRKYFGSPATCAHVWRVQAQGTSISETICREIAAARNFFGIRRGRPRNDPDSIRSTHVSHRLSRFRENSQKTPDFACNSESSGEDDDRRRG
jgi:hypothetical protein